MLLLHIVSLCSLAAVVSSTAIGTTGKVCPYLGGGQCAKFNPVNPACRKVVFGECNKETGLGATWYHTISYNIGRNLVTVQRYTDSDCTIKDPEYSNPAPAGYPGSCIGPVAQSRGIKEDFIVFVDDVNINPFAPIHPPRLPNGNIMPLNPNVPKPSTKPEPSGSKDDGKVKQDGFYGLACAHIGHGSCVDKFKVDRSCRYINFGKCTSQPTIFFNRNFIVDYDEKKNLLTFRRFSDSRCTLQSSNWILLAPQGRPNTCIGPIDKTHGVESFLKVEVYFNTTSTSNDLLPNEGTLLPNVKPTVKPTVGTLLPNVKPTVKPTGVWPDSSQRPESTQLFSGF